MFTKLALLLRTLETGCCDFAERDGTRERAPLSADNTISEVNAGVPVLMNASSLWASRLQVSTYKRPKQNPSLENRRPRFPGV